MRVVHFILLLFVIFSTKINSQLSKIFVLNEGAYDFSSGQITVPVSLGVFDVNSRAYHQIAEIPNARFASDIVIHENSIWIAADKYLVEYDLSSGAHIRTHEMEGIRKVAIKDNLVIITRGEYLKNLSSYVQVLNKLDLSVVFEIPSAAMGYTAESIILKDQFAYIGVNNGFDFGKEVGKILKLDLDSLKWIETIDLGPDGRNPENLMLYNDVLLSLNNKDFTGSSVSVIDLKTNGLVNHNLADVQSLCGTSTLMKSGVLYQEFGETALGRFDISLSSSAFFKDLNDAVYGMVYSEKYNVLCAGVTDFKTFGEVHIYNEDLVELFRFNSSIAPGYFAFQGTAVNTNQDDADLLLIVRPNPAADFCYIQTNFDVEEIVLFDLMGNQVLKQSNPRLDIGALPAGTFLVKVSGDHKISRRYLVKQ